MAEAERRMRPALAGPPGEQPCVWVTAGVLSYRPCDREFDCEACPLYQALRSGHGDEGVHGTRAAGAGRGDDPVERYMAALGAGCALHLDRAYTAEGLWVERQADTVAVGLDDYTLRLLHPVDEVVLPRPGGSMRRGAPGAWISRGRHVVALRSPVAGEVLEVQAHPALAVPAQGGGDGRWWFRMAPREDPDGVPGLLRDEALLRWYLGRVRTVRVQLDAAMAPPSAALAGPALADGGIPALDLEIVLGRERFDTLLGTLFPLQS